MQPNANKDTGNPRRTGEPVDDELQQPDQVPSFLTARELQAKDPAKGEKDKVAGERHASASFTGPGDEPPISDDEPPRGDRGLPETRTERMLKENSGTKKKGGASPGR